MNWDNWLPLLMFAISFLTGIFIFPLANERFYLRTFLNMLGATAKLLLLGFMLWGVYQGHVYISRWQILPGLEMVLHADFLSLLFTALSALLWFLTTIYAIGYLEHGRHRSRFFGFFSICVSSTIGIAMAGNLFTFFIFYELLTLSTYPLVIHRGSEEALQAGRIYLQYTIPGSALLLLAVAWLHWLSGTHDFAVTGYLGELGREHHLELRIIFVMLIAGFGVKAALVPLHGWLPRAMVAPAPVSALLHAVAVVKAGLLRLCVWSMTCMGCN